jgi:hypothetical protein
MTERRAVIDVSGELLAEGVEPLSDSGLVIIGSLAPPYIDGTVRLLVEERYGRSLLPAECEKGLALVRVRMTQESYGRQKIVRVTQIDFVDYLTPEAKAA